MLGAHLRTLGAKVAIASITCPQLSSTSSMCLSSRIAVMLADRSGVPAPRDRICSMSGAHAASVVWHHVANPKTVDYSSKKWPPDHWLGASEAARGNDGIRQGTRIHQAATAHNQNLPSLTSSVRQIEGSYLTIKIAVRISKTSLSRASDGSRSRHGNLRVIARRRQREGGQWEPDPGGLFSSEQLVQRMKEAATRGGTKSRGTGK
jgi:hypothetical protein